MYYKPSGKIGNVKDIRNSIKIGGIFLVLEFAVLFFSTLCTIGLGYFALWLLLVPITFFSVIIPNILVGTGRVRNTAKGVFVGLVCAFFLTITAWQGFTWAHFFIGNKTSFKIQNFRTIVGSKVYFNDKCIEWHTRSGEWENKASCRRYKNKYVTYKDMAFVGYVELVAILLVSTFIGYISSKGIYCESCQKWVKEEKTISFESIKDIYSLEKEIEENNFKTLLQLKTTTIDKEKHSKQKEQPPEHLLIKQKKCAHCQIFQLLCVTQITYKQEKNERNNEKGIEWVEEENKVIVNFIVSPAIFNTLGFNPEQGTKT